MHLSDVMAKLADRFATSIVSVVASISRSGSSSSATIFG